MCLRARVRAGDETALSANAPLCDVQVRIRGTCAYVRDIREKRWKPLTRRERGVPGSFRSARDLSFFLLSFNSLVIATITPTTFIIHDAKNYRLVASLLSLIGRTTRTRVLINVWHYVKLRERVYVSWVFFLVRRQMTKRLWSDGFSRGISLQRESWACFSFPSSREQSPRRTGYCINKCVYTFQLSSIEYQNSRKGMRTTCTTKSMTMTMTMRCRNLGQSEGCPNWRYSLVCVWILE